MEGYDQNDRLLPKMDLTTITIQLTMTFSNLRPEWKVTTKMGNLRLKWI